MKVFGLIGKKLSHSFSKNYFETKFKQLNIADQHTYELFELNTIDEIKQLLKRDNLVGLNVTVPYKQEVIHFLDELDQSAKKVGAVNVIRLENGIAKGYNSDYFGFKRSLENWLQGKQIKNALILGSGGASKAVSAALNDLDINSKVVSRSDDAGDITYRELNHAPKLLGKYKLIINTTPLGMYPVVDEAPEVPYAEANDTHWFYDLVYNPEETLFLKRAKAQGANTKNGLEMLHLQAEKSWEIWNSK